ncbi:MAG: TorF family putative porin [Lysobacterales bacterium]|jgi:uncharacterized protein (TIGR02001 family)
MNRTLGSIGLTAALLAVSAPAFAVDLSANIGYNSQYIFRGIPQKNSSAFGGLDLNAGGFYLGTWGADVGDGLEVDYYGGYGFDAGPVSLSVGGTIYTYTGDFDDTYKEINLSAGWSFLTFDVAVGNYENFGGPTLDYEYYSVTAEYNGFYGRAATFANDFDGSYFEAGYGNTLSVQDTDLLDYTFSVLYSDSTLLGGSSDWNMVLTLSKSFDL